MFSVGMDVDTRAQVSTLKILLYSENFYANANFLSPPIGFLKNTIMVGTILKNLRINNNFFIEQSAGNFRYFTNTSVSNSNVYTKFSNLPKISDHIPYNKNEKEKDFNWSKTKKKEDEPKENLL